MAPELWKRLMKSASPGDFYERLSRSEQGIVDRWKEKREILLRDMVQKEIEASLEGDATVFRESTPFMRAYVKSYELTRSGDGTDKATVTKGAMLTIWNPSEQQLGLFREGNVVRIRNLSVRASKHEGLLQLTAGSNTQMESVSSFPTAKDTLTSIGYSRRLFEKLIHVHLTARKLSTDELPSSPAPEVDTAGILLRVLREGRGCTEERELIYFTDETGLVLRVEREHPPDEEADFDSLSWSARQNIERHCTIAFRDLRVTHFDSTEKCAVAVYAETSSIVTKVAGDRLSELKEWAKTPAGHWLLRRVASSMDASVPVNQCNFTRTCTVVGYIEGFCIPGGLESSNHSHLEIRVDCGGSTLQVFDFPFFLLDEALQMCSVAPEPVSLGPEQEEKHAKLKVLGKIFSARGLLLLFSLRKKPSNMAESPVEDERYEVRQIKVANPSALADVYLSIEKGAELARKMQQERKSND